jgi:hypothetical protein
MADDNDPTNMGDGELRSTTEPRTGIIGGQTFKLKKVRYSDIEGEAIFEGDIVLGTVEQMEQTYQKFKEATNLQEDLKGIFISGSQFRWEKGVIPYRIDQGLPDVQRGYVNDAIAHWESKTPIRFVKRTTEVDFVTFRPRLSGCSSPVGRQTKEQFINLGPLCNKGNVIHEIGHTVGLWHEHSREDRKNFITIDKTNIIPGKEHNFDQHITDGDDIGSYDYGSIMHYSASAFALNTSKPTIITPNNETIGQREGLSKGDIEAVKKVYGFA